MFIEASYITRGLLACLADDIAFLQCVRSNILRRRAAVPFVLAPHILAASYWRRRSWTAHTLCREEAKLRLWASPFCPSPPHVNRYPSLLESFLSLSKQIALIVYGLTSKAAAEIPFPKCLSESLAFSISPSPQSHRTVP